jgi:hypothetical protein
MANNLSILDGAGASKTVKTTDNTNVHTPHHNIDTLPALPAGNNNIGDVDIASIAAGDNNIGNVDVVTSALPTGASTLAEQQTQTASLSVLDDWDETDRAKVNVVVGQAGITAGAGAVAANTPRVTHASDDPVTTALQIIDDWDETDRAKVNPIVGQAGVAGGAGAVSALTQRVVVATDQTAIHVSDDLILVTQTPTITAGAYASGDTVGGLLTFANAAITASCTLVGAVLVDKNAAVKAFLELQLFRTTFTPAADNDAHAITDAEALTYVGSVNFVNYTGSANNAFCSVPAPGIPIVLSTGTSVFGILVARDTPTYTGTADLTVVLIFQRNK